MSDTVRLSSKLPGDEEINGLDPYAGELHEETTLCAVVWLTPREVRRVIATGAEVPIVEIRRIEVIGHPHEVPLSVIELVNAAHERRTGRAALPFAMITAPKGEISELSDDRAEERLVRADVAAAEMLMGMSPEEREDAMSDGDDEPSNVVQLAVGADQIGEVYSFDGEDYGDE